MFVAHKIVGFRERRFLVPSPNGIAQLGSHFGRNRIFYNRDFYVIKYQLAQFVETKFGGNFPVLKTTRYLHEVFLICLYHFWNIVYCERCKITQRRLIKNVKVLFLPIFLVTTAILPNLLAF